MSAADFDLESLVHVEQTFFDAGYADGHAHGRMHGLIEGRALGREKGYELWEEVGFYEGFARMWEGVYKHPDSAAESRAEGHIRHLLELVSQFPRVNPSAGDDEIDVGALLSRIRTRYKALCATLGVRPRLRAAAAGETTEDGTSDASTKKSVWNIQGRQGSNEMSF